MRFIFNFIFFGLLFFIIWQYFPETFSTLVSWAHKTFDFLRELVNEAVNKVQHTNQPTPEIPKTLYDLGSRLFY